MVDGAINFRLFAQSLKTKKRKKIELESARCLTYQFDPDEI